MVDALQDDVATVARDQRADLAGSVANPDGGPTNAEAADGVNNWARTFPERKQIKAARLVTTEF